MNRRMADQPTKPLLSVFCVWISKEGHVAKAAATSFSRKLPHKVSFLYNGHDFILESMPLYSSGDMLGEKQYKELCRKSSALFLCQKIGQCVLIIPESEDTCGPH